MVISLLYFFAAANLVHSFSLPSTGFRSIKSWDDVKEPWDKAGRRYGPNWSVDDNLDPVETPGQTGAMVWPIPYNSSYVHPEMRADLPVGKFLRSRPNLGICMSGGGMRAATCALGWYRGLNHLNLLQKARYVSANSGATWTSLPLTCRSILEKKELGTDIDLDEYLGKYEGKYDDICVEEKSLIGKNLVEANILDPEDPLMEIREDWNWENDFWLDLSNAYLWNSDIKPILDESSLPFPVFVATAYDSRNNKEFFPIENTLLYSGVPLDPRKLDKNAFMGGGFVQGVALNAASVEDETPVPFELDDNKLYLKEFENPSPVVKIAELTSASSNFGASGDAMLKIDLQNSFFRKQVYGIAKMFKGELKKTDLSGYFDPGKYKWWSPTTGGAPVDLNFVDGGMFDNLGVLALLRRGCSTIIVCDSCDTDVCNGSIFDPNIDTIIEETCGVKYYDVASLFGRGKSIIKDIFVKKGYKDTLNDRSKVFAPEEFDFLMKEMRALRMQGKPLVVRKKLPIIPNPLAGVYDEVEVDMIFCFNGAVDEFCKPVMEEESGGPLGWMFGKKTKKDDFPYVDTLKCDYTSQEVSKLASLSSYNLVEGLKNVGFDIEQV
ncbi:hypothetical protein QTG54_002760 [Skeletonema marinoi]|uniref:PLA2c domain-containing protein n=1 Tax=Skeletonema marinoi TaxID=267567 RepID=A0AAD8YH22_9STRA|nr:hypothetical protein QTG54_002760 [Skeletonema marinoi]